MKSTKDFNAYWIGNIESKPDLAANFYDIHYEHSADFDRKSEILASFNTKNILLCYYVYHNYEGEAFILYEENGELYEVNAGHCSCYGLEGRWEPEKTSVKELQHRLVVGHLGREYSYGEEKGESKFDKELELVLMYLAYLGYK